MFHHETDASKAALVGLVEMLDDGRDRLVDTQWQTPHLASLGVREMAREDYLRLLPRLLQVPPPQWPSGVLSLSGGPAM